MRTLTKKLGLVFGQALYLSAAPQRTLACVDCSSCFSNRFDEYANCVTACNECVYCDHNDCDTARTHQRFDCERFCDQNACQ